MGFILEAVKLAAGEGQLVLGASGRRRLNAVRPAFAQVAQETGVPQSFLEAIAWGESSFRPEIVGPPIGAGPHRAYGLMQIHSANWPLLESQGVWENADQDWKDPRQNIRAGIWDLRRKGLGDDDIELVLKRYGGFRTVDHKPYVNDVLNRATFLWLDRIASEAGKGLG